jgi:hypothetical protein
MNRQPKKRLDPVREKIRLKHGNAALDAPRPLNRTPYVSSITGGHG